MMSYVVDINALEVYNFKMLYLEYGNLVNFNQQLDKCQWSLRNGKW